MVSFYLDIMNTSKDILEIRTMLTLLSKLLLQNKMGFRDAFILYNLTQEKLNHIKQDNLK